MLTRNLTLIAIATLLVVGTLGTIAPPAAAQIQQLGATTTEVKLIPMDDPIKPLSGSRTISGQVVYSYVGTGQTALVGTAVTLSVAQAPPWAVITITPSTLIVPVAGTAASQTVTKPVDFKVLVATTADAPAFSPATLKIQAVAAANAPLTGSQGTGEVQVTADFFSIIDARADTPIQIARPQSSILYPVVVSNFGNADTKVTFSIESADKDLTLVPPQPFLLQARQNGGKQIQQTVNVQVQTPYHNGYLNKVGAATLKITSNYALDIDKKGDASQVTILTTTKGFYVPGPSPFLVFGLLGLAAVFVRKAGRA